MFCVSGPESLLPYEPQFPPHCEGPEGAMPHEAALEVDHEMVADDPAGTVIGPSEPLALMSTESDGVGLVPVRVCEMPPDAKPGKPYPLVQSLSENCDMVTSFGDQIKL